VGLEHTEIQMKLITIKLTPKQIESITTALMEWGSIELDTFTGKAIGKHMHETAASIRKQLEKTEKR
jgi:hypothetical protein